MFPKEGAFLKSSPEGRIGHLSEASPLHVLTTPPAHKSHHPVTTKYKKYTQAIADHSHTDTNPTFKVGCEPTNDLESYFPP